MVENIRAIVLRTVRYGDLSLIVDTYTREYGRKSFVTSVGKSRSKRAQGVCWRPLAMVEFAADVHESKKLPKPKDVSVYYGYLDAAANPLKVTVMLFLAEFLAAALRNEERNEALYYYIESSLKWFDSCTGPCPNFHLVFLMRLSRFVGVYPNVEESSGLPFFDLVEGCYKALCPPHSYYLTGEEARALPVVFRMNYDTMRFFKFSRRQRKSMLDTLNTYYRIHVPDFPELKSIGVLAEVFD